MKKFLVVLACLVFVNSVYGWEEGMVEVKESGKLVAIVVTIPMDDEGMKAFSYEWHDDYTGFDVFAWFKSLVMNRKRKGTNQIAKRYGDKNVEKMTDAEKKAVVKEANIKTKEERDAELGGE